MGCNKEDWAVFWCSLLSPVLPGEIPRGQRERYFHELSREERLLPNGQRRRISVRTLRRQWERLRKEGVAGLYRRGRSDRGKPRLRRAELVARAVELKKEQPRRSDKAINRVLQREFSKKVPRSTLSRHLRLQGATRRKLGVSSEKVRCRWTRDQPDALWVGDFEHGPLVVHQGQSVKTHLSAWIDCHSRYVVEARYYVRENLDILVDSLLRAWGKHGASRELYVDNAKIYHSKARQRNAWPLSRFTAAFARLLGRKGGVSGLTAQEMEVLAAFHARHDRVTEGLLRAAFAQAPSSTIPEILFHLQSLLHERTA